MKRSTDRILTTYVGRLQRPEELTTAMEAHPRSQPTDRRFAERLKEAAAAGVRQQLEAGIDIVARGRGRNPCGEGARIASKELW